MVLAKTQSSLLVCTQQGWVRPQWTLSVHNPGGTTEIHNSGRQPLGRSTQWFISLVKHSSSTHPKPQVGAGSVVDKIWERPPTVAAQVPGYSTATSIPAPTATLPSALAHSTPHPSTRSGTNTSEKGT